MRSANASAERSPTPAHPGTATIAERFILLFRLPYVVGCTLVGGLLFGFLPSLASNYAETGDFASAVRAALAPVPLLIGALVALAFYVPQYMRERVEQAGQELAALHPGGADGYGAAFARVSALRPQLVAWFLFLILLLLALSAPALMGTGPAPIQVGGGPDHTGLGDVAGLFSLVSFGVITLGISSVVWSYWSVSMGIRRFGDSALRLRPYYEDGFLGLKPVGSLALSLATAYFAFIGLFLASLLASPTTPEIGELVGLGSLLTGLVVLGLLLFFLPLKTLHERMAREKQLAREGVSRKLAPLFQETPTANPTSEVGEMLRLDLIDRKVSAMAVWPFDLRILGRLSAIALSVTAILISRILSLILLRV